MRIWWILLTGALLLMGGTSGCAAGKKISEADLAEEKALAEMCERLLEEAKKRATVPIAPEMLGMKIEKTGHYTIMLIFQPGVTPLPDFERDLRNNFTGEIEVFCGGMPYTTIYYEDFSHFAPAPVGSGYGPVYSLEVRKEPRTFDFHPRIRGRRFCRYGFSIARKEERRSLKERLGQFFDNSENEPLKRSEAHPPVRADLQVAAELERMETFLEEPALLSHKISMILG